MNKSDHLSDFEKHWDSLLDRIRSENFHRLEDLAEFLKRENAPLSIDDLTKWGRFQSMLLGHSKGLNYVPQWLIGIFSALVEGVSPKTICDPWAGTGALVKVLRKTSQPKETIAFTMNQGEHALGTWVVPEADWQCGHPLDLLKGVTKELDVIASVLPMGMRSTNPLKITLPCGNSVELFDDLGNLVMVAASMHLSASGIGLFVVTPSFFLSMRSVFHQFNDLGLGVEASLALPPGTFAPFTNIPAYLIIVRRKLIKQMFVAQLSKDASTNLQIIDNFRQDREGGSLELGRFVSPLTFKSLDSIRLKERLALAEQHFGAPSVTLEELATAIILGRFGDNFAFDPLENSLFIPLIGNTDVTESLEDLSLKNQNYAQVVIDPARSNAKFVARFLNSELGKELRELNKSGAVISKFNKQRLKELTVFVPDLATQERILEIETGISVEQNTVLALENELVELRRELWANPHAAPNVKQRLNSLAKRLAGGIKQHTTERLDQWFETLPFPLASILRAWQAVPSEEYKTKYEHLLHFFEATAQFLSIILLSAFSSNEVIFEPHKQKLAELMRKQKLSFDRATFGTWKLVFEYLSKQTRELLSENGKSTIDKTRNNRDLCAEMFSDTSLSLPQSLSHKELSDILSDTNKMRNDWTGHGGMVGKKEAQSRNEQLNGELQKLRRVVADTWSENQLMQAHHHRYRSGIYENEVSIMMGSNTVFLKESRSMSICLDVERLYLAKKDSQRALMLLPLVQVGPSPQSANNACYFFNRLDRDGARFISYHFTDLPERQFPNTNETIRFLTPTDL